jgi:hypothetical protein
MFGNSNEFEDLKGNHVCIKEWQLTKGVDQYLEVRDTIPYLLDRESILISHDQIAWKCMDDPSAKLDNRYIKCDISYPGIVVEDAPNPFSKKYRMIDGSHRMAKMLLETLIRESYFYVLTEKEFYSLLKNY